MLTLKRNVVKENLFTLLAGYSAAYTYLSKYIYLSIYVYVRYRYTVDLRCEAMRWCLLQRLLSLSDVSVIYKLSVFCQNVWQNKHFVNGPPANVVPNISNWRALTYTAAVTYVYIIRSIVLSILITTQRISYARYSLHIEFEVNYLDLPLPTFLA